MFFVASTLFPKPLHPDQFLKVPGSGYADSGSATFVPAWDFKVDNMAVDAQSLRDFVGHVIPPAVSDRIKRMSAGDAKRARLLMSFWDFALQCDEQVRTETTAEQLRLSSGVVRRQEEEIEALRSRVRAHEEESRLANEARLKAEADLQVLRLQKGEAEAALAPLRERTNFLEAENAALVDKDKQLQSRFDDLTNDLAAARKEITDLEVANNLNLKDFNEVEDRNMDLADDLERLQRGIPGLVKLALASDSVTAPFKEFLTAVQEVEVLQTVNLFAENVENLPTPLPDAIVSKVNPDCYQRAQAAGEALKSITIPFIERIGSEMELSVDEILEMRP